MGDERSRKADYVAPPDAGTTTDVTDGDSAPADPGAGSYFEQPTVHLPSMRRASPWSRRLFLIVVISVALFAPLWIDPVTLDQFRGATPFPIATEPVEPLPTVAGTPDHQELFKVSTTVARDDFDRNVTMGWGAAEIGGSYTTTGPAALLSTANRAGTVRLSEASPGGVELRDVRAHDVEVFFEVSGDGLTVEGAFVEVLLRLIPGGTGYRPQITIGPGGGAMVTVRAGTAAADTALVPPVAVKDLLTEEGGSILVRAQAIGSDPTTIRMRAWPARSDEPLVWQVSVIDWTGALQHDGAIGVAWGAGGSLMDTAPVLRFDDLVARANAEVGSL